MFKAIKPKGGKKLMPNKPSGTRFMAKNKKAVNSKGKTKPGY